MIKIKNLSYLALSVMLIFSACQEDDEELPGQPPIADAGDDIEVTVGSAAALDGSGSSDPDGDALSYSWSISQRPDGSNASLSATSAQTTFTPDVVGTYQLQLSVSDGVYDPVTDLVTVEALESLGDPPVALILNGDSDVIDETNNEVTVNTAYALDGSGSSDPDSEDLTYTWEVTESPEGSSPTVTPNEDGDMADFTTDLVGEYTVQLTVEDPEGNTNSTTVELVATANPVVIDENIDVATTWANVFENPALPDYYVVADVSVREILTIAPGVKVMFEPNRGLTVTGNNGALVAIGKEDSLIVMTAEDSLNGWDGIIFFNENVQNEFNYADISYGGQNDFGFGVLAANIGVESAGGFKIANSTVSNSFSHGIFIENGGLLRESGNNALENNDGNPIVLPINQVGNLDEISTFTDNTDNAVEILGTTLNEDDEMTVPALSNGTPYFLSGKLDVDSGLKLMAGVSIEGDPDAYIEVSNDGYLTSEGTDTDNVVLTAREQADGWGGIIFFTTNSRNTIDYTTISYGGNRSFGFGVESANLGVESQGEIRITNSTISNSVSNYGIFVETGGAIAEFGLNTFTDNGGFPIGLPIATAGVLDRATTFSGNGDNSVEIFGSTLASGDDPQTLPAFADETPYYISGKLNVDNDLVIKPGATLEFNQDVSIEVSGNDGALEAVGTADSLITFTARDQADGWMGIVIFTNTSANKLDYVNVSYGGTSGFGFGVDAANVGIENGGKMAITNSSFTNSLSGYGIFIEGNGIVTDETNTQLTTTQEIIDAGNTFEANFSGETNL
ncbi:PKD domain-containing protein [Catalinimonas sp. 4WD22]|uniref:PKD domain-containing protein n=1 Tax=Catalinimonas locisalis TaxID=3133978 RepID=UPI00310159DF